MSDNNDLLLARARAAEAWTNPPGVAWRDLLLSRFVGQFPDECWDVPVMLIIEPTTVTSDFDPDTPIKGFFQYSSRPQTLANMGGFEGTLDVRTREFTFRDISPEEPWTFRGRISENGRVMNLTVSTTDGFTSETFSLIHEETFDAILEDEVA